MLAQSAFFRKMIFLLFKSTYRKLADEHRGYDFETTKVNLAKYMIGFM